MDSDRLFVLTGGPGSGKTTLIEALAAAGVATSPEVGRAVIREQLATGGNALPWADQQAFAELMVVRDVAAREAALAGGHVTMLDRGVPDVAGFLRVSGLPVPPHIDEAARTCRYNARVFIAPFWPEIFTGDAERKQSPDVAEATFAVMVATYRSYDYELIELPRVSVAARLAFVVDRIGFK
ncbi:AAA family ATPase [Sphingomonas sp. QA11]|uniref:AAA family ATPase n=1 Tax=Sphingomonas sp. QA11 TaxID=2950605 RepID=UPI00234A3DF0|nr:AAA family ATPase [Sphingomonas sp. QA11]WCM26557.1 AAA family ATPase [Sphingomonas sp. QA11]